MNRKYLPKHIEYIRSIAKGSDPASITKKFNKRFKVSFTQKSIQGVMGRYGITTQQKTRWTPEMKDYIKKNVQKASSIKELTAMMNVHFGIIFTKKQIHQVMQKNGIKFRNNKWGVKPLYAERVWKGYILVKISMTGDKRKMWKEKHRWVWEQANGRITKGSVIIFLDGNKSNCALKNLAMLSRTEVVKMNQLGLFSDNREVTLTGIAIVRHSVAIHDCLRKMLDSRGHKLFVNKQSRERIRLRGKGLQTATT